MIYPEDTEDTQADYERDARIDREEMERPKFTVLASQSSEKANYVIIKFVNIACIVRDFMGTPQYSLHGEVALFPNSCGEFASWGNDPTNNPAQWVSGDFLNELKKLDKFDFTRALKEIEETAKALINR